jgi:tetratricopeptide (TPR) repeat protein/DNA-binding XRE family transcriptional regulator
MTETAGLASFYGDAIHALRWRRRWSVRTLSEESGVSRTTILSYEWGKTVPGLEMRKKIAHGLSIEPADLDLLAASLQRGMPEDRGAVGGGRLVTRVATGLAGDFQRAAVPLIAELAAASSEPPPAASEEEVRALAPVLRRLDAQDLHALVDKTPSLRRWAFVKLAGEESARAAANDARRALELASFALRVAEQVSGEEDWASQVFGWAYLGNARRVGSDLAGAKEAFSRSAHLQAERPADRPELPEPWRLLDLEASLRIDLRQLPEALRLLDQAVELAPRTGSIQARLLCNRSNALERMGDSEGSIVALREALAQIECGAEPGLLCIVLFNLIDSLCSVGQTAEAAEMLPELRRLQAQMGNGLNQIRLRWLEGKIDAGLGRIDQAIEALSAVRAAFAKEDLRYDEAQACMELAGLYLEQGRTAEVKRLVLQMEPVFRAKGVHVEARKALLLFRRAVEMETVTVELAGRIAGYLRRAQHDPELRFEEVA